MSQEENGGESQKYQKMMTDLEAIIAKVSNQDLDLDEMVQEVDHGYQLIQKMRERLSETKEKIETLRTANDEIFKEKPSPSP